MHVCQNDRKKDQMGSDWTPENSKVHAWRELKKKLLKHLSIKKKLTVFITFTLIYSLSSFSLILPYCFLCLSYFYLRWPFFPWHLLLIRPLEATPPHIFLFSPPLKESHVVLMVGTCCDPWPLPSCPAGSLQSHWANTGTSPGNLPPRLLAAGERQQNYDAW